jgi:hypothetical protein
LHLGDSPVRLRTRDQVLAGHNRTNDQSHDYQDDRNFHQREAFGIVFLG